MIAVESSRMKRFFIVVMTGCCDWLCVASTGRSRSLFLSGDKWVRLAFMYFVT